MRRSQPNFLAIELNIETEAGALQNAYGLAEGLPAGQRAVLERQAQACAVSAIESGWPELAAGQLRESTRQIDRRTWHRRPRPAVSRLDPRR